MGEKQDAFVFIGIEGTDDVVLFRLLRLAVISIVRFVSTCHIPL